MPRSNYVRMSPEDLERVLRHLPEPQYAHLGLVGFEETGAYADVLKQAEKLLPDGTNVGIESEPHIELKNPRKERILEIYRKFHRKIEATSPDFEIPGIDLQCIGWYSEHPRVSIFLNSEGVAVRYDGGEPDHVSKMRQELAQANVRVRIRIND